MNSSSAIESHFDHRALNFAHTARAVGWYTRESQTKRYDHIVTNLPQTPFSLLDVGCGQGDFYHHLKVQNLPARYKGIDVSEEQIKLAQLAYPSGDFYKADLNSFSPSKLYDVVIACGAFNLLSENHDTYLKQQLKRLVSLSDNLIVVSTLLKGKETQYYHPESYAYYSKEQYETICSDLPARLSIQDGYLPNDVLLVLKK